MRPFAGMPRIYFILVILLVVHQLPALAQDADMDGLSDALDPFPYVIDGDGDGVPDGTDMFPSIRNIPIYILFSIAFFILYLGIIRTSATGYRPHRTRRSQQAQYRNSDIQDTIGLNIESSLDLGVQQLRTEQQQQQQPQGGAIHVRGNGTSRRRNIFAIKKNNGIKVGDIKKETLCHACKGHEQVKFICPNCGKYYCEQCASDIDETCLVCSNLLSPVQ